MLEYLHARRDFDQLAALFTHKWGVDVCRLRWRGLQRYLRSFGVKRTDLDVFYRSAARPKHCSTRAYRMMRRRPIFNQNIDSIRGTHAGSVSHDIHRT